MTYDNKNIRISNTFQKKKKFKQHHGQFTHTHIFPVQYHSKHHMKVSEKNMKICSSIMDLIPINVTTNRTTFNDNGTRLTYQKKKIRKK